MLYRPKLVQARCEDCGRLYRRTPQSHQRRKCTSCHAIHRKRWARDYERKWMQDPEYKARKHTYKHRYRASGGEAKPRWNPDNVWHEKSCADCGATVPPTRSPRCSACRQDRRRATSLRYRHKDGNQCPDCSASIQNQSDYCPACATKRTNERLRAERQLRRESWRP